MKLNQKSIQYILLLLILAIAVSAYQFGYVKYIEKANRVKQENVEIERRISELQEKETHREEWLAAIDNSEKQIREILAKYGAGNSPEKSIMFVRSLEDAASMKIPSISFSTDTPVFISSDTDEDGNPRVELDQTSIAVNYNTTYDGLKACMDYINTYTERMNVGNFSANYNPEDGQLTGNMIINLYSVKDADHVYTDPVIGGVDIGTDNIFGTVTPVLAPSESTTGGISAEAGNSTAQESGE